VEAVFWDAEHVTASFERALGSVPDWRCSVSTAAHLTTASRLRGRVAAVDARVSTLRVSVRRLGTGMQSFSQRNTVSTGCSRVRASRYRGAMGSLVVSSAVGLSVLLASAGSIRSQTPAPSQDQPAQHAAAPAPHVFGSDAGLVLNFIKPDKTADFEAVITKLKEALQKSDKPERGKQAASWRVFRAVEPAANGGALYVFIIDPAVKGADYTVSTILAEAFPDQVQALYKQYAEAYVSGQNFVNLTLVSALGEGAPSTK
jgi:hypothetical protein